MKILFWNTCKNKSINYLLSQLINENEISIVALAEYDADIDELIGLLSEYGILMRTYLTAGSPRIEILGSLRRVEPACQSEYASVQIINGTDILCCVHLPSQVYSANEKMRELIISQIVSDLCSLEKEVNTENTIVVGDFNMNPYESGCINANLFHGIPIYREAERKSRVIAKTRYSMFYNPMWNFLGDFEKPYGTYYHVGNRIDNTYWYLYDQVIIRPSLRKRFVDKSLKILTETQSSYLLDNRGHPDKNISDHLPIMFELEEDSCG